MKTLKNRSLATKISFPPLVVIILSVLVSAYTWSGLQQVSKELTSIEHYRLPQATVTEHLARSVLRSKEIVSNYLNTKDESELLRLTEQYQSVVENLKSSKTLSFSTEDQEKLNIFFNIYERYYQLVFNDIRNLIKESKSQLDYVKNTGLMEIVHALYNIELSSKKTATKYSSNAQMHIFNAISSIETYYQNNDHTNFEMAQLELDAVEENLYYLRKNLTTMTARRAVNELFLEVDEYREASNTIRVSKDNIQTLLNVDLASHSEKLSEASDHLMKKVWDNVQSSTEASIELTDNVSATSIIFSSIAILIAAALSILIIRSISNPIRESVVVANGITEGNLSQTIESHSTDETGQLLSALQKMQSKIKSQLNEITNSAKESQRISIALDNASSSIMLLDHEHKIIYLNNSIVKSFSEHHIDIKQQVSDFDATNLIGRRFEIFSDDVERTQAAFDSLKHTITHKLRLGAQTYMLSADPVFDENNEKLGSVVQWENITEQLQMEAEVKQMIDEAKSGNLDSRISIDNKSGFFRTLCEEMNALVSVNESVINGAVEALGSIAKGDLTGKMKTDYQGSYATLNNNINRTIDKLITVISSIKNTSQIVDEGARNISEGNNDLSQRTQVQSSELDRSARSMIHISGNVNEAAQNAEHANKLALDASEKARAGGSILSTANDAMTEINHASLSIRDIISVMDEIAFQTNLLALNASVEAAHAGSLGRGFAVVADEVRSLAQRSADAAKEIKVLINDTVTKVDDGARLVIESSDSLDEIIESVTQVSTIINQISHTSASQSSEIEAVSKSIEQLDCSNQENAVLVNHTATASESLRHQVVELTGLINFFSIEKGSEISTQYEDSSATQQHRLQANS